MTYLVLLFSTFLNVSACDAVADAFPGVKGADWETRRDNCLTVIEEAHKQGVDPFLMLGVAWEESRLFSDRVSSAGAQGILQVTRHWCEDKNIKSCDLTHAGVRAIRLLRTCKRINWDDYTCKRARKRPQPWPKVLCHYNAGNKCGPRSHSYAKEVLRARARIMRAYYGGKS